MLALRRLRSAVAGRLVAPRQSARLNTRYFSSQGGEDWRSIPRDADQTDVLIVGGGPSGLSAAIRIKQLAKDTGKDLRVCLLEKGQEVGMFIFSVWLWRSRNLFFFPFFAEWLLLG
jgi:hypothetical protein